MTKEEYRQQVMTDYQQRGYKVFVRPGKALLPEGFEPSQIDMIAVQGDETIAVQVKGRNELYDLADVNELAGKVESHPGWSYELLVCPATNGQTIPEDGVERGVPLIQSMAEEAEKGLAAGLHRGAFLVAWAAVEAAMREAARREGILVDRETPRFILKMLYSMGVISREDHELIDGYGRVRNAVVHGFEPPTLVAEDTQHLLNFAKRLIASPVPQAEPA
jgi:hypothetical protein